MSEIRLSLCITTFNRTHLLKWNLERLCSLTKPFEVIVVDDGGSDGCEELVNFYKNRLPIRYIYNHNPDWTVCSLSRNIGLKASSGDLFLHIEPELIAITDFIPQMLKVYGETGKIVTAGTIYHGGLASKTTENFMKNLKSNLSNPRLVNESKDNTNPTNIKGYSKIVGWIASFAALYRRQDLMDIQGWNEELVGKWGFDDTLLLTRLRLNGVNQERANEVEFIHQYHNKLPPNVQFTSCQANEKFMIDLGLNEDKPNNPNIIANRGREWGNLRIR